MSAFHFRCTECATSYAEKEVQLVCPACAHLQEPCGVTRGVLEAMARVPGLRIGLTTKSTGILRDRDLLASIARASKSS